MATHATSEMQRDANIWEDCYSSAVFSGIIGDDNHDGGYHISIEDNPPGNYSIVRPDDAAPPGDWPRDQSAGVDMSMSTADMKTDYARMLAVYKDQSDPRRKYLNAYNGWDGVGSAKRIDFYANKIGTSSEDHKWHGHKERRRRYVNSKEATNAIASIHKGLTKDQYLESIGIATEDDMPWMIRSGAEDKSVYLCTGATTPNGKIAAFPMTGSEFEAYKAQTKLMQLPSGVKVSDLPTYDIVVVPWPVVNIGDIDVTIPPLEMPVFNITMTAEGTATPVESQDD